MYKNRILPFLILLLGMTANSQACSMYKITKNGKTIVGNNEDYLSPNSQFWYEVPASGQFGVMYMGLLNNFAQGGINDKGLVFDGFAVPYLAICNAEGKSKISIGSAIKKVMQTMSTVGEVKAYLETIDLSSLTQSMVVFVDKSGDYLIVEGDELILGKEPEKSFSNFYYSQTVALDSVNVPHFQNGRKFLASSNSQPTMEFCGSVMEHFAQKKFLNTTQYSTVYDLNTLKIRVYLFHDYSQFVEIDLNKELQKGNHKNSIAALFPKESAGYKHYASYNNAENPALFIAAMVTKQNLTETELEAMDFADDVNIIGYEWLEDKQNPTAAIKVFEYAVSVMPNNWDLYDSLGEAYLENKDWSNALKNYEKSLVLNPKNENAVKKIAVCREK